MVTTITVERFSVTSSRPLPDVLEALRAAVGHPDINELLENVSAADGNAAMEAVIQAALGPSGFVEFARYDQGEVVHKGKATGGRGVVRLMVGNPLVMRRMVAHVPDAGSYAPVTILVDERSDGVHLSYDRMASFLAPYRSPEASAVARDLDAKVEALITKAAG